MKEMMTVTTAFIREETAAASKKKGHAPWKPQDQPKRHVSEWKSDFRGPSREGRWSNRMTRQKVTQSFARISEVMFPPLTTTKGTDGSVVIEAEIGKHMIHRMYVDGVPQRKLLVTIGDVDHSTKAWMNFMIVRSLSPYNGIIRRPGIREIQAVPSIAHEILKFPIVGGIVTIHNTILIPAEYATVTTSSKKILREAEVRHENLKVALHPNFSDQEVIIGGTLSAKGRTKLCSLLKENLDIFAWWSADMIGVPRSVAEHRLNIREGYSPVRQKKRGQAPKRAKAIQEEMAESNEEKTAFHTNQGVYCYTKMPFGLKNAGATYQRLVDKAFDNQVGRNIEVYVDDLVIKSHTEAEMLRDIDEMFPEKSLSLFKTLKKCIKKSDFHWTLEAEQAFMQLKQHLSELPLLVAPKLKEELIVYMSASYGAIKYEALIAGLQIAAQMGVRNVHVSVDSKLVANQVLGTYVAKEENMVKYLEKAKILISGFANFSISQVLVEVLKEKSIQEEEVATVVKEEGPRWMTLIMEYLKDGTLPDDRKEESILRIKARHRDGLFHEVDRGESRGKNHRQSGEEVRVGQHSMPLRSLRGNSVGQRNQGPPRLGKQELDRRTSPCPLGHRTIIKSSHGDTPFSLTYGTKTVIPVEIGMPTYRTAVVDAIHNDEELRLYLDLLEERHEHTEIREAKAKLNMTKYYNARVRGVTFRPGDFVSRSNDASHVVDGGKISPKWEGPY
ncbi:reverse transcriptase domain-containing protein [Tanacetum coccineum]